MTLLLALMLTVLQGDSIHIRHVAGAMYVVDGAVDQIGVSAGPDGVLRIPAGIGSRSPDQATILAGGRHE